MEQSIRLQRRFAIIDEWLLDLDISDRAVRLYAILARYADSETHKAYPSRKTLASRLRCSTKSVDRAAQELVDAGAMTKEQRFNSSIVYTLLVVQGDGHQSPGGWTEESRGVDTGGDLTITTELEPTKPEPQKDIVQDSRFDEWWSYYPRKEGKGAARKEFAKAIKKVSLDELINGADNYRNDPNREPKFTVQPARWLREERWDDGPLPLNRSLTNSEKNILNFRASMALLETNEMKEVESNESVGSQGVIDFGINLRSTEDI